MDNDHTFYGGLAWMPQNLWDAIPLFWRILALCSVLLWLFWQVIHTKAFCAILIGLESLFLGRYRRNGKQPGPLCFWMGDLTLSLIGTSQPASNHRETRQKSGYGLLLLLTAAMLVTGVGYLARNQDVIASLFHRRQVLGQEEQTELANSTEPKKNKADATRLDHVYTLEEVVAMNYETVQSKIHELLAHYDYPYPSGSELRKEYEKFSWYHPRNSVSQGMIINNIQANKEDKINFDRFYRQRNILKEQILDEIENAVRLADDSLIKANPSADTTALEETYSGAALDMVKADVESYASHNEYAVPVLHKRRFDQDRFSVQRNGREASIRVHEVWSRKIYSKQTRELLRTEGPFAVVQRMSLSKPKSQWFVDDIKVVSKSSEIAGSIH